MWLLAAVLWALLAPAAHAQQVDATIRQSARAEYPAEARDLGIEGRVLLLLRVDAEGRVTAVDVIESVHPLLDAAAVEAGRALRFDPATVDGEPVASEVRWRFGFSLGYAGDDSAPALVNMHATVTDSNGLEIPNVIVTIRRDGADPVSLQTNASGRFTAKFLTPGAWTVVLDKEGFLPAEYALELPPGETVTTRFVLNPADVYEYVVVAIRETWRDVVRGDRAVVEDPVTSTFELTRRDIESTPGSLEDIARAAHALPGVVADGDLLAGFHVRGGEQGDVVYLIDRIPLDNPFHLAGFNSVFNPDMIDTVKFYSGAPPADVPAATSAVMAVESWDGTPRAEGRGIDGAIDISASSARALVMGPLDEDEKVTVALAARRTYLEGYFQVMKWLNLIDTAFAAPEYSELSGRVAWRPNARHRLMFAAMRSGDSLALIDSDDESVINVSGTFELNNALYLTSLDYTARLSDAVELRSTAAYTDETSSQQRSLAGALSQRFHVRRGYGRSDVTAEVGDHTLKAGLDGSVQDVSAEGQIQDNRHVPAWAQTGIADLGLQDIDVTFAEPWAEASGYAQATLVFPVRIRVGARGTWTALTDRFLVSPRAGVSVPLLGGATVPKASWGLYHRTPRDPFEVDPEIGNPDLVEERAQHFVVGIDQAFALPGHESGGLVRVEGYHIELSELVVNPDTRGAVEAGTSYENEGSGRNDGVDVMVVARSPRWGAQLTYGLLFARRTNPLNVRYAETIAPPQDQRHTLGLSGEWQPLPHWRFTARYAFHSGRPISPVTVAGEDTVAIVSLNSDRLGPTHQVDVRAEWRRAYRGYRLTFYAELLNVGNIQSPFLPIHDVQEGQLTTTMLNHLPMRPFLGLRADF